MTNDESIVNGGPAAGVAGLEANVGNVDVFFDAAPGQQELRVESKKLPKKSRDGGGRTNTSRPRGRSPAAATTAASDPSPAATPSGSRGVAATVAAVDAFVVTSGKMGDEASAKDAAAMGGVNKVPTRERSQQMYDTYRHTQVRRKR